MDYVIDATSTLLHYQLMQYAPCLQSKNIVHAPHAHIHAYRHICAIAA